MIKHVLKDGTVVQDITGKVIHAKDNPVLYEVISRINEEGNKNESTS